MSQKCLQQKLENELKGRASPKCENNYSRAKLQRLEAFLLMHHEDLQQPSLTRGAWLLELPVINHFTQNCSAALGNPFQWPAELRVEGGEFEEGAI